MPSPQNIYILIHRTCEYVTLHGKKNFEVMIKLKILTYGEIIVKYPSGPSVITSVLISGKRRQEHQRRKYDNRSRNHAMQSDSWLWKCKRTMTQGIQEASRSYRRKEMDSPPEPEERMQPCWNLDFSLMGPFQFSDLQNCKIINLCCLKPLSCGNFLQQQKGSRTVNVMFLRS